MEMTRSDFEKRIKLIKKLYEFHLSRLAIPHTGETSTEILPDLIRIFENIVPRRIFEIGFNRGSSSLQFLLLNHRTQVLSIDITEKPKSIKYLKEQFGPKFAFLKQDSQKINRPLLDKIKKKSFDLAFIDGKHTYEGIKNDFNLILNLEIPYLLLDDYFHPSHEGDMRRVIRENSRATEIVEVFGSKKKYPKHCGLVLLKNLTR
jgi:hypothetical protein